MPQIHSVVCQLYCICDEKKKQKKKEGKGNPKTNGIDSHPDPIMQANGKYGYYRLGWNWWMFILRMHWNWNTTENNHLLPSGYAAKHSEGIADGNNTTFMCKFPGIQSAS